MKQIKWFDRKFIFPEHQDIFPSIIERLRGTPIRLADKMTMISRDDQVSRIESSWSIAENVGHLLDLEPLWLGRLEDILQGRKELRSADLENTKTHLADHNNRKMEDLIESFTVERRKMISELEKLTDGDIIKYGLHPRLKTPMRMIDLFLFVAEHDDHHLARMTEIVRLLSE